MENKNYKSKQKPPSRIRYEKKNPVFSVRMPKEWHDTLNELLEETCQSRRDFLGVILKKQKANYKRVHTKGYTEGYDHGHENGHNEGYKKGMNDWVIWTYCWRCGKAMHITQNSDAHKKIIDQMQGYLSHSECPQE